MLIYLNGSINSGKSTLGKLLAKSLPQTVHIEVDHLRHFADCLNLTQAIPFCIEDTITLTRNWLARGFNVVVSWPISERNHALLESETADFQVPTHTFTLRPQLEVVTSDRGGRRLSDRERSRIEAQYQSSHIDPGLGTVIDNSNQTPEETLATIRAIIRV